MKKILLTGGGTGGSVTPLLAVAGEFKKPPLHKGGEGGFDFLFLGTKNGPEREIVEKEGIEFRAIAAGKLRRYFSWRNFFDLFLIKLGFIQSFFIILKWKPDLVMTAGSFVSVPVVWAAWLLRVPVLVHQQDARPGLANKLMAPFARVVTVTFEESLKKFDKKAIWTGNPSRNMEHVTHNIFNSLTKSLPTVLIIGGGTGAMAINELVWQSLDELTKFYNVIHITGKDKNTRYKIPARLASRDEAGGQDTRYKQYEFLDLNQMSEAYATADIVVSRAGMGVLTELSYLGKPAIIIPMPDSHQEDNAKIFKKQGAAIVLNQKELAAGQFANEIKKLLENKNLKEKLSANIGGVIKKGAGERIGEIAKSFFVKN